MTTVKAYARQSLLDVALTACGSVDYAYDIAKANGLPIETTLEADTTLIVPHGDQAAATLLKRAGVNPATGLTADTVSSIIGTAAIGETFIIA